MSEVSRVQGIRESGCQNQGIILTSKDISPLKIWVTKPKDFSKGHLKRWKLMETFNFSCKKHDSLAQYSLMSSWRVESMVLNKGSDKKHLLQLVRKIYQSSAIYKWRIQGSKPCFIWFLAVGRRTLWELCYVKRFGDKLSISKRLTFRDLILSI